MTVILFMAGLVALLGQVALLRELSVAFYGSELIYTLALGAWLFWTAVGAAAGRRRFVPAPRHVRALLVLVAVLLPLSVAFVRGSRGIFSAVPGAYLPFPVQLLVMALALLPTALLSGLLFQWAAKSYITRGRTLALAYGIECAGGVAGGLAATLAIVWGVQNLALALACGLASSAAALVFPAGPRGRSAALWAAGAAGLLAAALIMNPSVDMRMTSWDHPDVVDSRDTPYNRLTVTSRAGQTVLFANNALAYETQGTAAEEFVHLAALQHADPARVLILGGGVEGLVRETLQHHPDAIDYVELDGALLDLVSPHLPPADRLALGAPGVTTTVSDPRRFLAGKRGYDLILVGMPEPSSGQANRFYTREFFELCARAMAGDGVLALRLPSAENLWTPPLARRNASIVNALRSVFGDALILPGTTNIVLASRSALTRDPGVLTRRLEERGVRSPQITPEFIDYIHTNDRIPRIEATLAKHPRIVNTDARPVCYQYTQLLWLSQFLPTIESLDPAAVPRAPIGAAVVTVLVILFLLARRRAGLRRALFVAVAGLAGMVLETMLILEYQVQRGVLYQDLGVLLMLFMAGLAAGAALVHRWAAGRPERHSRRWGIVLLAAFAVLAAATGSWVAAGGLSGLAASALCLFLTGGLVAAVFAHASLRAPGDPTAAVSPLYAADLLGGCAGSVVATLVLLPVLGLAASAWSVAVLCVVAVLLV